MPAFDLGLVGTIDADRELPGGTESVIRTMVRYADPAMRIGLIGVRRGQTRGRIGHWEGARVDGRDVSFYPALALPSDGRAGRAPTTLRLAAALGVRQPAGDFEQLHYHRLELATIPTPRQQAAIRVAWVHGDGVSHLAPGRSRWSSAARLYWPMARIAARSVSSVLVTSPEGARNLSRRLGKGSYCPTWYDPDQFFPDARPPDLACAWVEGSRLRRTRCWR